MREQDPAARTFGGPDTGPISGAWPQRRGDVERPVQTSLLDRLTDSEPTRTREPAMRRDESVDALKRAVRRDLEWLLNSRRELVDLADELVEARRSVLRYGLPDVSSLPRDGGDTRVRLVRMVEEAVTMFEPRLTQVRVIASADPGLAARTELRFTVEAMLRLDPLPERVVFDTVLEMAKGEYQIVGEGHAHG